MVDLKIAPSCRQLMLLTWIVTVEHASVLQFTDLSCNYKPCCCQQCLIAGCRPRQGPCVILIAYLCFNVCAISLSFHPVPGTCLNTLTLRPFCIMSVHLSLTTHAACTWCMAAAAALSYLCVAMPLLAIMSRGRLWEQCTADYHNRWQLRLYMHQPYLHVVGAGQNAC